MLYLLILLLKILLIIFKKFPNLFLCSEYSFIVVWSCIIDVAYLMFWKKLNIHVLEIQFYCLHCVCLSQVLKIQFVSFLLDVAFPLRGPVPQISLRYKFSTYLTFMLDDINVLDDGRKKKIQSIRKEQFREKFVLLTCVFARVFKLSSFVQLLFLHIHKHEIHLGFKSQIYIFIEIQLK